MAYEEEGVEDSLILEPEGPGNKMFAVTEVQIGYEDPCNDTKILPVYVGSEEACLRRVISLSLERIVEMLKDEILSYGESNYDGPIQTVEDLLQVPDDDPALEQFREWFDPPNVDLFWEAVEWMRSTHTLSPLPPLALDANADDARLMAKKVWHEMNYTILKIHILPVEAA